MVTNPWKRHARRDLIFGAGTIMCLASLGFALNDYVPDSGDLVKTHDVIIDHLQPGASYSVEARDLKYGDIRGLVLKWRSTGHLSAKGLASKIDVSVSDPDLRIDILEGGSESVGEYRIFAIISRSASPKAILKIQVASDFPELKKAELLLERPFIDLKSAYATAGLSRWDLIVWKAGLWLLLLFGITLMGCAYRSGVKKQQM